MVICWFGIYDPTFSRNRIYMRSLQERGHTIIECRDSSPGFLKWWRLYHMHRALRGQYDALVVGYPGHVVVPLARLISNKKVIADLLGSLSDAGEHSHHHNLWHRIKNRCIDWLAVSCAHIVLVETEAQKNYFIERFGRAGKYRVMYTGVDEKEFYCSATGDEEKKNVCTVLFRGALKPESGVMHILGAAKLLQSDASIQFLIIGTGHYATEVQAHILKQELRTVNFIHKHLSFEELRSHMCGADISLGQLELNPRLDRTIPHKAFESMHMELPYITADTPAIREVFEHGNTALFVPPADPEALAGAIRRLAGDVGVRHSLARAAKDVYNERYSTPALATALERIVANQNDS
jgi:glycosyltransferase involved in cell wall biosynthesis